MLKKMIRLQLENSLHMIAGDIKKKTKPHWFENNSNFWLMFSYLENFMIPLAKKSSLIFSVPGVLWFYSPNNTLCMLYLILQSIAHYILLIKQSTANSYFFFLPWYIFTYFYSCTVLGIKPKLISPHVFQCIAFMII